MEPESLKALILPLLSAGSSWYEMNEVVETLSPFTAEVEAL